MTSAIYGDLRETQGEEDKRASENQSSEPKNWLLKGQGQYLPNGLGWVNFDPGFEVPFG